MAGRFLNNKGAGGLLVVFLGLFLVGNAVVISIFLSGFTLYQKSYIQKITDLAVSRAACEVNTSTETTLEKLGEGLTLSAEKTNEFLNIDRNKADSTFNEVLRKNIDDLNKVDILLITPINIRNGIYEFYLEDTLKNADSIERLAGEINSYLNSKTGEAFNLNIENRVIDKPTYLAVIKYDTGFSEVIIESFSGSQTYRRY